MLGKRDELVLGVCFAVNCASIVTHFVDDKVDVVICQIMQKTRCEFRCLRFEISAFFLVTHNYVYIGFQ